MNPYSSWYSLRDEVKDSLTCLDYINRFTNRSVRYEGHAINAPDFIRSDDSSPSFGVWEDHCFDFATQKSYDIISLCALDKFNGDTTQALEFLGSLIGRKLARKSQQDNSSAPQFTETLQKLQDRVDYWHSQLLTSQSALDYLASRNISLDTAKKLKLGFSPKKNRLMIPYLSNHGYHPAVYFVGRDISGSANLRYQFPKNDDPDFAEVLDHIPYGIHSARPGFFKKDTLTEPGTDRLVTLDTHNIRYDYLCITEGTLDVISFLQDGWACISGKKNSAHFKEFLTICKQYRDKGQKLFLCFDNDNAGQKFQKDLADTLLKNNIPFVCAKLPDTFTVTRDSHPDHGKQIHIKDISDFYSAGGSLESLVRSAQRGIEYLAECCRSEDELETLFTDTAKFCRDKRQLHFLKEKAVRLYDPSEETETDAEGHITITSVNKPRFNPFNVKIMYSEALKPLQDFDISHMVLEKHNLIYDITGKFYEYSNGAWRAVHNMVVEGYVIQAMGGKINSGKMQSVRRFMQSFTAQACKFNTKPIFVFDNGTLWLDEPFETVETVKRRREVLDANGKPIYQQTSGVCSYPVMEDYEETIRTPLPNKELPGMPANFRKHTPDDMNTIKVNYSYVPDAVNEELEDALNAWFDHDEEKKRLARQEAGYILFASCCLQKFFYLIGDGANGKSTFLHIIEGIFGHEHGTSLSVKQMGSGFDSMLLKDSAYNMSYDSAADLNGCEEIVKAVSSGDPIVAAHKGVDAETFRTRSKLFIAANRHFSANDVSHGLLRRIVFLAFNKTFKDGEADPEYENKILQNLPGLFNWAYQGYLDLKASGKFCETKEQAALMEEFKEQLSGTLCFFREYMQQIKGAIYNEQEIYSSYKGWAKENGEKTLSKKKFISDLRQVLRVEGSDIQVVRDEDTRAWQFIFPELQEQEEPQALQPQKSLGALPSEEEQVDYGQDEDTDPGYIKDPEDIDQEVIEQEGASIDSDIDNDLQIVDDRFEHKFTDEPLSEAELERLCIEPDKSSHYEQITRDITLSDARIQEVACKTLASEYIARIADIVAENNAQHPEMTPFHVKHEGDFTDEYFASEQAKKDFSSADIRLRIKNLLDGTLRWTDSLKSYDKKSLPVMCETLQIALVKHPVNIVLALIQHDGAVKVVEALKNDPCLKAQRKVYSSYDPDSGFDESTARTCFYTMVKYRRRWTENLYLWAALREDPIRSYTACLEALATYCVREHLTPEKQLPGLEKLCDFSQVHDRPRKKQA